MRIPFYVTAALALAVCSVPGACAAGRTTIDPNLSSRPQVSPAGTADKALDQKITYHSGYKRLSGVMDDLAEMTRLTIRCGRNNLDWQVRDIPVVVDLNDMPLGKVLRAIADSAHLQFITEKTTTGDGRLLVVHRLYRTRNAEEEVSNGLKARQKATRKLAEWAWDALASAADAPDQLFASIAKTEPGVYAKVDPKTLCRLLAAIGPSDKESILSGEAFAVRAQGRVSEAITKNIVAQNIESLIGMSSGYLPTTPTQDEMDRLVLAARVTPLEPSHADGSFRISVEDIPIEMETPRPPGRLDVIYPDGYPEVQRVPRAWIAEPIRIARQLASIKDLKIPPPPDLDAIEKALDPTPNPELKPLVTDGDWTLPLLQTKVKLDIAEDKRDLSQADLLTALAEASGVSIVCEDFVSHTSRSRVKTESVKKELTLGDLLKTISSEGRLKWFLDEDRRLLVGWAGDWRTHHTNLAPAEIIDNLVAKRTGSGAELEDMVPLFRLTRGQCAEWVNSSADLSDIQLNLNMAPAEHAVWLIYDALSPQNRAAAKSESGLSLSLIDSALVSDKIRWVENTRYDGVIKTSLDEDLPSEHRRRQELLSDPAFVVNCVMRLKSHPITKVMQSDHGFTLIGGNGYQGSAGIPKTSYSIELTGQKNGKAEQVVSEWLMITFPSFTHEREFELASKQKESVLTPAERAK